MTGVSNIAWPAEADSEAFAILRANSVGSIEVAPTRIWPQWQNIDPQSLRRQMADAGFAISSLQAMLFQKPELRLFGSDLDRIELLDHLSLCADITASLGAKVAVFGAPKNRDRGALDLDEAFGVATAFFAKAGQHYASRGVMIGFEANPASYGCNFATTAREAARLVRAVASPGFQLHLDTACMYLAGESAAELIRENADIVCHFHASEPNLGTFHAPAANHQAAAQSLREIGYRGTVVLEMRTAEPLLPRLSEAVAFLSEAYGT